MKEFKMLSLLGSLGLIAVWLLTWVMTFDGTKASKTTSAFKKEIKDLLDDR
jgi:hypothetical protein